MSKTQPPRFVFLLGHAHRALQRWIEARPEAWEDISSAQVGLLFFLRSAGMATVGEASTALRVAPAAITRLSKRMQATGLIDRMVDEQDSRKMRLTLTDAGEAAGLQAHAALQQLNTLLSAQFSEAELMVVARWLKQVSTLDPKPD
ncbi:MarR family winged helix-turn-helix transcriptional regulator [Serratia rhizosphaerae]|uniref:MarR family transcriptional regulator n=1 Tax=Serratia rhizosphaerae TaxID=2597702 RepID=A0ABX6GQC6_9GAMM|nr:MULTISPECIES: MarR family transcriptional regulator [Serratia]MBU3891812.1 MarR family transcriptional regulator [Serratia rubidaea]AVJ18818.1 MarR family transcriptional regulator [Serratia sp. MYb239]MCA4823757.1 MarR family transcriptional regulator [Serratia rubidaea]MEB6336262.1 MarR family transcriptional regulator [Serratia rhizosphaerae]QHA88453.1 MarR family transcriptional regulator [Serratia rhizosphaerae]